METWAVTYSIMPTPCRVEDIAAFHVQTILSMRPEGPYFIGGWCVDGVVAYEVARQLRARGDEVGCLILFDAEPPDSHGSERIKRAVSGLPRYLNRLRYHARMARTVGFAHLPSYILGRIRTVMQSIQRKWAHTLYALHIHYSLPQEVAIRDALAIQHYAVDRYWAGFIMHLLAMSLERQRPLKRICCYRVPRWSHRCSNDRIPDNLAINDPGCALAGLMSADCAGADQPQNRHLACHQGVRRFFECQFPPFNTLALAIRQDIVVIAVRVNVSLCPRVTPAGSFAATVENCRDCSVWHETRQRLD